MKKFGINNDNGLQVKDIPKMHKLKKLSINVFEMDQGVEHRKKLYFLPTYRSKNDNEPKQILVDLLPYRKHYCLFEKLHTFIRTNDKKELCSIYPDTFSTEDVLKKHWRKCSENEPSLMKFPKEDSISFKDFYRNVPFYFIATADFECKKE